MSIKKPFILCIFLFGLLLFKNNFLSLFILLFLFYYQWKYKQLNKLSLILICFIFFNSKINYSFFDNIILETHENYVIASIDHKKVLVYTDDIYFNGEKINVINDKKKIESLSNFNIFNFESYMNYQNIEYYYDYEDVVITKTNHIQRKMYEYIRKYDDKAKEILLKVFYQFDIEQNLFYSAGLHYSYINRLLFQFFYQLLSYNLSYILSSLFVFGFGVLFPTNFSFYRILFGNLIKIIYKNESKKEKIGYHYLLCLFFFPNCVTSLSFIIPFLFQIIQEFIKGKYIQLITSKIIIVFVQFLKMNECQLLPILFFEFFQKINVLYLILSLIQLIIPFSFVQYLHIPENIIPSIVLYGHVPKFLVLIFIFYVLKMLIVQQNTIFYLLIILLLIPLQGYINPFYKITFINVGQGDSILIQAPFQLNNTLIDIPKNKENVVIDYLHSIGVYKLDTLVFTHSDSDHNGGKESFVENFKVDKIIESKENVDIYKNRLFQVNHFKSDEDNDQSIVLFGSLGEVKVCLMGDASTMVEKSIIEHYDFTCDVLKVGHHGSKTSTDPLFIQNIQPKFAIISAGENNYYGHPHLSVLETLNQYHVKIYETKNGAIEIKNFLKLQIIKTSEGEFDIMILE